MKKIQFLLAVLLLIPEIATAASSKEVKVTIDGTEIQFDGPAIVLDNRVFVPMRGIFETLNTDVKWNSALGEITTTSEFTDAKLKLKVGSKIAYNNDKKILLDAAPLSVNNRVLVPLRLISESIGAEIKWDPTKRTVQIKRFLTNCPMYYRTDGEGNVNRRSIDVDVNRVLKLATIEPLRPISEQPYNTANHPGNFTMDKIINNEKLVQTVTYINGSTYSGTFQNGLRSGKGKLDHWFDYEGEFKDDYMHGQGKLIFDFGDTYEGEFKYDTFDGYGVYTWPNGSQKKGIWKDGELVTPQS